MTKRVAALLALVAFAVAWLIGVARGHSPFTRLENAALALAAAYVAGLGIGVALERIVLFRLSESWRETKGVAAQDEDDSTFTPGTAPARRGAGAPDAELPGTAAPATEPESATIEAGR